MTLDFAAHLPAIAARHHHVEQHHRRFYLVERFQCVVAVIGDSDWITLRLQVIPDNVRVVGVIVDDENRRVGCVGHKRLSEMMLWLQAAQFASHPSRVQRGYKRKMKSELNWSSR